MFTLIIFLLIFGLLVFVHEFGHFIMAKRAGVAVEEFGFGFPPKIVGWRRGGTLYSLNWIPLGGFVRIKGESGEARTDPRSFAAQGIGKRAMILLAGVAMNFLLGAALLSVGFMVGLPKVVEDLPSAARVRNRELQVFQVLPESPAARSGLKSGDMILRVNGTDVTTLEDFRNAIERAGARAEVQYRRGNETGSITVTPEVLRETGRSGIGVGVSATGIVSYPWYLAPFYGTMETVRYIREVAAALGALLGGLLFTGRLTVDLSGPVGIAVATGEVARLGFVYLLQFTALLSVNLGVINVLPIPALDGGRLLFLGIEGVRRRPVSPRIEGLFIRIGFLLLMLLVLFVTYHDLLRYGAGLFRGLGT